MSPEQTGDTLEDLNEGPGKETVPDASLGEPLDIPATAPEVQEVQTN